MVNKRSSVLWKGQNLRANAPLFQVLLYLWHQQRQNTGDAIARLLLQALARLCMLIRLGPTGLHTLGTSRRGPEGRRIPQTERVRSWPVYEHSLLAAEVGDELMLSQRGLPKVSVRTPMKI